MHHPAQIDGRSVVIFGKGRRGIHVLESGILSYDGQSLWLAEGESRRVLTYDDLRSLLPVAAGSRIRECRSFDFFLPREADD